MDHQEKVRYLIDHAKEDFDLSPWTAAPPLWRLLWSLGSTIRPPHFIPGRRLFVFVAVFGGVGFGLTMGAFYLLALGNVALGVSIGIFAGLGFGIMFGAAMTAVFRRQARSRHLPPWEQFPHGFARPMDPVDAD